MTKSALALLRRLLVACCRPGLGAAVALGLALPAATAQDAAPARLHFDVPAGTAESSLKRFSMQLRLELVFPTADVAGVRTNAVRGEMTVREALDRMLAGTDLTVAEDAATGMFTIRRGPAPAAAAPPVLVHALLPPPVSSYDGIVQLTPFEVAASSRDIGYYTQNTLAGTRLNSNLADLGSSITIISKQQMADTSAVSINDLFLYEASTEGTENYTSLGGFGKGAGVGDNIQASPQTANRVRGLGSVDLTRDYFVSNAAIQLDSYNLDDVELSRGPNSTLFGIGSPAGVLNESIEKAVLNKDSSEISTRFGSFGDFRSTLQFNRALIPDRLAIAVAGLYANAHPTAQEPADDIQRREFAAVTLQPFPHTRVRANLEYYDNPNRRANSLTPADEITPWLANGSPKWDPITYTATVAGATSAPITNGLLLPPGLIAGLGNAAVSTPQFYVVHGVAQLWEQAELGTNFAAVGTPTNAVGSVNGTGTNAAVNPWGPIGYERLAYTAGNYAKFTSSAPGSQVTYPLFHEPGITSPQLLNTQGVNLGAPNVGEDKAAIYNVEVEQRITESLFFEAGWYREQFTSLQQNNLGGNVGNAVMVDPNTRFLNGAPNPYFGSPFAAVQAPQDYDLQNLNEQERLSLVYQLDFTPGGRWTQWLGHHTLQAFYQHRENDTQTRRELLEVLDAHSWASTTDIGSGGSGPGGSIAERFYLGQGGAAIRFDDASLVNTNFTFPLTWYNTQLNGGAWTNENARLGPAAFPANTGKSQQQVWSYSGSVQDFLLRDHLVLTLGQRHDYERNRVTLPVTVDPATGLTDLDNLSQWGNWNSAGGVTRQLGGVLHLTPWLSVHYNRSNNFTVAGLGEDQFGNVLANPSGVGRDAGFTLSLFDDRLVAELNWYRSSAANSREGNLTYVTRALRTDYGGFLPWAQEIATNNLGTGAGAAAINTFAQAIVQYPTGLAGLANATNFGTDTQTVQARGWEFNLIYNPSRHWTMKLTADEDVASYSDVYPHVQAYLASRLPVWTKATDPVLGPFWTTVSADRGGGGIYSIAPYGSPQQWLSGTVDAAGLDGELAQQGTASPDLSKYHFNYLTSYQVAAGPLAGWGGGTALRYQTAAAIGYRGGAPDPAAAGAIDTLSPLDPITGKTQLHQDLWLSYATKLPFLDRRIRLKVQLNLRDLWSNGYLETVGVNPDAAATVFRIVPPRQYYLTTTFDF
jgi:hypothetical protein